MTDNECKEIIKRINFEEKWLFSLYAENRLSTGDIDIAMSGIRSVIAELKGEKMTEICKYCCHWQNGRCQKTKYNTDMLTGKGKWLGIKTSWNHYCRSGDFTQRKGE